MYSCFNCFKKTTDSVTQEIKNGLVEYYNIYKERDEKMCSSEKYVRFYNEGKFEKETTCKLIPLPVPVTSYINTVFFDLESPYTDLINHK